MIVKVEVKIRPATGSRQCGPCQLCCKLVPVKELYKAAGKRCKHQRFGKGCAVYGKPARPSSCSLWSCRWLVQPEETAGLLRPDRSHYVVDLIPDFVTLRNLETGEVNPVQVVQIWVDPKYPDAWREPALRGYLLKQGEQRVAALIRFDNATAIAVFPPNMAPDNEWHEMPGGEMQPEHSLADVVKALGGVSV
jgi:hypothetical protein